MGLNWGKRACALVLLCATTAIASPAQTFTTLHSFNGTDGANPNRPLAQATDGNLYGTAFFGGANGPCEYNPPPDGCGTIFKITPSGRLTTLYSFCSQSGCTDGSEPTAGLVQSIDGSLYGTTEFGGANDSCTLNGMGCGTVFKISPSGTLTTLHSFDSADGANPSAGLVRTTDGNLYGTTFYGGANGGGTIFKITPSGTLTTLYSFCSQSDCADGELPAAALVQATDGNFYGTTLYGGANGYGTAFKINSGGRLTTLHSFDGEDGAYPNGLVQAADGNFYGTTYEFGADGQGTVFKITPGGTLTTLHSFDGTDGNYPETGLVQATDGNFYGTTQLGGADSEGTVFRITPSGTLTTLHTFDATHGNEPTATLVQDTNGTIYGTTFAGGDISACPGGCGTVFSLSVGLGPFVETQPTSGKAGAAVKILGTNLTGATSVTFNGTPATFTVRSSSLITTMVPAGATGGRVQVVTPSGTLRSNVPFRVRQ
jgi:uncharacterized repeat protein (TIGR03803 family)